MSKITDQVVKYRWLRVNQYYEGSKWSLCNRVIQLSDIEYISTVVVHPMEAGEETTYLLQAGVKNTTYRIAAGLNKTEASEAEGELIELIDTVTGRLNAK
ncbi:hypothetical protein [Dyella silvatica]|uniref:hypothetical protein n=1 Tax=Dyella silvatica TaxID=2992128 RepID=UPI002254A83E|nr:hypothetical protein [Dyella silvatica]